MRNNRGEGQRYWSAEEDAILFKGRKIERQPWDQVLAKLPGRTIGAARKRFEHLETRGDQRRSDAGTRISIDPAALAASVAYLRAQDQRDLTAARMGDPPPGYSALDRKRQGSTP